MARFYISCLALVMVIQLQAQENLSLHFMQNISQVHLTNPAVQLPYGWNLGLPSVGVNYQNANIQVLDLFDQEGNTLIFQAEDALSKLDSLDNQMRFNTSIQTASLSLQFSKIRVGFFHEINVDGYGRYPKGLLDLIWEGNGPLVGDTVQIAPELNWQAYHTYGIGFAYQVNEKLGLGINMKLLRGMMAMKTNRASAEIYSDEEYYQLYAETDISILTSGIAGNIFTDDIDSPLAFENEVDYFRTQNRGIAIDFGATYQVNEKLSLGFSLIDMGGINWKDSVYTHTSKGEYAFDGLDVNPFESDQEYDFEEVTDSLESTFEFSAEETPFSTSLPTKLFLSGQYDFGSDFKVGALFHGAWEPNGFSPSFILSARKGFWDIIHVGAVTGVRGQGGFNFGLNASVHLAGIQLYALTDNIVGVFSPLKTRTINMRAGLNFAFVKVKDEKEEQEELVKKLQDQEKPRGIEFYDTERQKN